MGGEHRGRGTPPVELMRFWLWVPHCTLCALLPAGQPDYLPDFQQASLASHTYPTAAVTLGTSFAPQVFQTPGAG